MKRWLNRFNSFCQHWRQRHFFEKNWCCACHLCIAICGCSSELKGSFQGLIFLFHYLYQATIVKGDDTVAPTGQRVCLQTINKLKWLRRTHGRLMANIMTIGHCTWTRCDYPCDKSFSRNCLLQDHQSHKKCLDASIQHPCQFCDAKFGTFLGLNDTSGEGDVRRSISASNVMISHTSPNILILKITKMLSTPKTTPPKMISQCKCPLWSTILGCESSLTITHVNGFTQSLPLSSAYQINIVVLVVPICIKVVLDWNIEVILSEWRNTGLNFHKVLS